MAGVDDRRFDVKDILSYGTYGWRVADCALPLIVIEDQANPRAGYIGRQAKSILNGVFYIKKGFSFERDKLSHSYETRVWSIPVVIITQSVVLLQGIFDQARETFDRYTKPTADTPWSTSTYGTSTTYNYAGIEAGDVDDRINVYALDCTVYLKETFVDVKVS